MVAYQPRFWSKAPAIRLLLPFSVGIGLQWHVQLPLQTLLLIAAVCVLPLLVYSWLSLSKKFLLSNFYGVFLQLLLVTAGALVVWANDVRHQQNWIGNYKTDGATLCLQLEEPLVEKANSYKAVASVQGVYVNGTLQKRTGKIILYFKKNSSVSDLHYGSQILVTKPLQLIKNSGNPGSFDFKRYSLFNGITHQLYITTQDFAYLNQGGNSFRNLLFQSRQAIITILRKYISGDAEQGLAEALLIGYKDDLDKNLVQAYTNTGVVHVIAISGLHLGIIYWMLLWLTKPLKKKRTGWLRLLLIVAGLWSFSFLAGAQPSVLRSAVMFSAIALSTVINRKTDIYNTLALSALVLLCFNPYWLWDVGFQLSYTAVLSIIIFFRPIYNWYYTPNKIIDFIWKLMAASLAAQLLTLPVSIYHFHQFPALFLIANLFAVPLSSLILIGEILLCIISFFPPAASLLGSALEALIKLMNGAVNNLNQVPSSLLNGLSISILQMIVLYFIITAVSWWLFQKSKLALQLAIVSSAVFVALRTASFIEAGNQQKIIIYNVPKHRAIDIIQGRMYSFLGDAALEENNFLRNFHIQPSRIKHRIAPDKIVNSSSFLLNGKQIVLIDTTVHFKSTIQKPVIDLLILSRNPKMYISNVSNAFQIRQIVIDGSVPQWKAALWKKDCDSLQIACYNVSDSGAFVMKL